uniref:Glutathione S-transferase n=1 Tax=Panagrolaimus sp. JU765 TaxID=591449 RepID=A0AC34PUH2_9BILA
MVKYELIYFNVNARAGAIRLFLDYHQIPFTDTRIPRDQWPEIKKQMKFGQIPVLKILDKNLELPQSVAILRYLATKHGGLGENPEENALIDAFADQTQDTVTAVRPWYRTFVRNGTKEQQQEKFNEIALPTFRDSFVPIFSKQLQENGSGFLVGKKLTWVDFFLADFVDRVGKIFPEDQRKILQPLFGHRDKILSLPNLKKRLEERKNHVF